MINFSFDACAPTIVLATNKNLKARENPTCEVDAHTGVHEMVFLRCEYPDKKEIIIMSD